MRTTIGTLAATAVLALGADTAAGQAPPITLTGGHADWGVKESFRNYVQGPIAHGEIATAEGATTNADGTFRFPFASGTYDLTAHAVDAAFGGSVHFTGHDSDTGPLLDLTISNPRVETEGDAGTLYADMRSRDLASGQFEEHDDAAIATLDLTGSQVTPGPEEVTVGPIAAALTEEGAEAFAGFYAAGEELDPITLRLSYAADPGPDPDPDPEPTPTPTPTPQPQPQPTPPAGPEVIAAGAIARITAFGGVRRVTGRRVAVALLSCRTGTCTVRAPKRIRVRIAGKRYRAAVIVPQRLAEGASGTVRLILGKRARRALAGRKARVTLGVSITSGDQTITRTVRATLRRPQ